MVGGCDSRAHIVEEAFVSHPDWTRNIKYDFFLVNDQYVLFSIPINIFPEEAQLEPVGKKHHYHQITKPTKGDELVQARSNIMAIKPASYGYTY